MSTPTAPNAYQVIWVSGAGDRALVRSHEVNAASWAFDPGIECAVFKDADGAAVFTIRTPFFVSAELVTEKG